MFREGPANLPPEGCVRAREGRKKKCVAKATGAVADLRQNVFYGCGKKFRVGVEKMKTNGFRIRVLTQIRIPV